MFVAFGLSSLILLSVLSSYEDIAVNETGIVGRRSENYV